MNEYSHLTKGWLTQEEAWTELGIGKTKWYEWKKKGIVKTQIPKGETLQRVSREHLIELHETLFRERSGQAQEPTHLKETREEKQKGKAKKGDPSSD